MFHCFEALVVSTLSLTSPPGMHTSISSYLLLLTYNLQMLFTWQWQEKPTVVNLDVADCLHKMQNVQNIFIIITY